MANEGFSGLGKGVGKGSLVTLKYVGTEQSIERASD